MKWMPWSSSEQRRQQLKDGAEGGGMQGVKEIQGKEQEGVCGQVLPPPLRTGFCHRQCTLLGAATASRLTQK